VRLKTAINIRIRAILVIILTNLIIILFSVFVGINYVKANIDVSLNTDLAAKANLADYYISSEIEKLKLKARWLAENLERTEEINWHQVFSQQQDLDPEFIGIAVFSSENRLIAGEGDIPASFGSASPDIINDKYLSNMFSHVKTDIVNTDKGGISISSTIKTDSGVVFYMALPLQGRIGLQDKPGLSSLFNIPQKRILVVTLPGTYFRELLYRFTIWDTGHIFISDADGYAISNPRENWVKERFNYIHAAQIDDDFIELAKTVTRMTRGETGAGYYTVYNIPRVGSFRPISGSEEGWSLGVVAPLTESPVRNIDRGLIIVALISIILNILAAIIASDFIKRPFEKIAMFKEEADAANKAKSAFLSTMSHEMRTPLNAIVGLSELILNTGEIQGETEDKLGKIHNSGMTLLGIVNDILDISKIESGKFELHPVKYDSPSLVNDIVSLNIVRIGEKPIKFILTVDENLPQYLFGDDLRIKQVFNNLLSNAFKYTNSGTVEWSMSFERDGDNIWLISKVKDTGMGIKSEDIHKLFKDYSQLDAHANRKVESTGLGLSITKRLVDMMDGTITAESEYGKGMTFSVRLRQQLVSDTPIGKETAKNLMGARFIDNKRAQSAKLKRIDLSYASVLVVDDMPVNLDVAKGMMVPYKLRVDCASSGQQAIDIIRACGESSETGNVRYDAVFMDHMMPGMDGIEAVRIIREEIGTDYARNIPIIALTANAIIGNEELFLEHGFHAFISKPIDMMRLDSVLRQWVRNKDREGEQQSETVSLKSGSTDEPLLTEQNEIPLGGITITGVDITAGLKRFAGNEEEYIKVLKSYTAHTRPLLGGLEKNLSSGTFSEYAITVHGIKGASFGIGASYAGSYAERLEQLAKAGETEQVLAENSAFLETMNDLLDSIDSALSEYKSKTSKPSAAAPDPELLQELRKACAEYDVGKIDSIMSRLDSFEYENGGELITWLREHIDDMNLTEISSGNWP